MLWLIRFIGLVVQAIILEFVHFFGLAAFLAAIALGYFRAPLWITPIVALVCGVVAYKFVDLTELTGLLDKASSASERAVFVLVVYFVITILGYLVGVFGRASFGRRK